MSGNRRGSGARVSGLVSVILPVRNRPELLCRAAESVQAQAYPHWELWIVDDASTDETLEVAIRLAESDGRIRWLQIPHGGPGAAREAGRQRARGEFLQYLDSDDRLLPEKFSRMVAALQAHPEAAIAYCPCREIDREGRPLPQPVRPSDRPVSAILPLFFWGRFWNTPVPLYRRALTDRAGAWLPLQQEEDWELDVRIGTFSPTLVFVDEVLVEVLVGGADGLSGRAAWDRASLRDRARAHLAVAEHARAAGFGPELEEVRHLARALFLLSRQCGARGLVEEARALLEAAGRVVQGKGPGARGLAIYRHLAAALGWERLSRWSERLDRLRSGSRRA